MNCSEATEALDTAQDGELDIAAREALERHLASCPACAAERARLAAYAGLIGGLRWPAPGPELDGRLRLEELERLAAPVPARPRRWFPAAGVLLAASLLMALVLGLLATGRGWKAGPQFEGAEPQPSAKQAAPAAPSSPFELHAQAHRLALQGRTDEAIAAFEALLARSSDEPGLADNALFWIGELHRGKPDPQQALRHYLLLVERFPASELAPPALWRAARLSGERARYEALPGSYPKSLEARRAARWLAEKAGTKAEAERWWRWLLEHAAGTPEWEAARKALKEGR